MKTILLICAIALPVFGDEIDKALEQRYKAKFDEVIGRGGHGEIRGSLNPLAKDIAVKISKIDAACSDYRKEYVSQDLIFKAFEKYNEDKALSLRATFLKPYDFTLEMGKENYCFYGMQRLYPLVEETNKLLTQIYLGKDIYDKEISDIQYIRGHYLGYTNVENLLSSYKSPSSKSNVEQVSYDLGTLLAIMHLGSKMDGADTEVVIARKDVPREGYQVVILDFDRTLGMETLFEAKDEDEIAERIVDAMNAEPYFPNPTSKGFAHFRKGYLDSASHIAKIEHDKFYGAVANKVIERFIDEFLEYNFFNSFVVDTWNMTPNQPMALKYGDFLNKRIGKQTRALLASKDYYIERREFYKAVQQITDKELKTSGIEEAKRAIDGQLK